MPPDGAVCVVVVCGEVSVCVGWVAVADVCVVDCDGAGAVFVPVDCPWMTPAAVRALGDACSDAAVPPSGPLPGAWAKSALPLLERRLANGPLALYRTYEELDVVTVELDPSVVADIDTPGDLSARA